MRRTLRRALLGRLALLAGGTTLILEGCDPTLQSTVEDGIINASTSLFASFLQALLQAATESAAMT